MHMACGGVQMSEQSLPASSCLRVGCSAYRNPAFAPLRLARHHSTCTCTIRSLRCTDCIFASRDTICRHASTRHVCPAQARCEQDGAPSRAQRAQSPQPPPQPCAPRTARCRGWTRRRCRPSRRPWPWRPAGSPPRGGRPPAPPRAPAPAVPRAFSAVRPCKAKNTMCRAANEAFDNDVPKVHPCCGCAEAFDACHSTPGHVMDCLLAYIWDGTKLLQNSSSALPCVYAHWYKPKYL